MASTQGSIWVDGHITETLPLPDRGLDFGDGLFETLLLIEGKPLYLDLHMQRLKDGLRVLGFPRCLGQVSDQIRTVLNSQDFFREAAMRITVTRGTGPRGYLPPNPVEPRVIITVNERAGVDSALTLSPAHLALAKIRWGDQPELAGIKHLNRLEQVMAAIECKSAPADELVMLNQQGQLISVSAGNLFVVKANCMFTPSLSRCGVSGTRRHLIMEKLAPALGFRVEQAELSIAQLESADEVFYSNALIGVRPVASFGAGTWSEHAVCEALHKQVWEGEK